MDIKNRKVKIAIVKHAGLCIGGSELWLQKIAAHLPKDKFEVDFYYCDDSPHIGGEHVVQKSSEERGEYLKDHGVNLIKFNVGTKDLRTITHDWIDTDFWKKFDETKYDLVQTTKAGPREYPFYKMKGPVVEIVGLALRPDTSSNISWSWHPSPWQRARWVQLGGKIEKSSVLTSPIETPQTSENYRQELGIPEGHLVAGFHQRADNLIASPVPLEAFGDIQKQFPEEASKWHFVVKNGAPWYREQAEQLDLKNVHFLPATSDYLGVSKFLNTIDVFAHGRKDGETFGAVFVEAMIHGKPCLSHYSKGGANASPETMGPAGLLAMNKEEYASLLYKLLSDANFRQTLASKAKPHAEEYFSINKCIEQVLDIYGKILNTKLIEESKLPIPYYYSDLGFIYATREANLQDENDIAYRALVGGAPRPLESKIFKFLVSDGFRDIYPGDGLFSWIACKKNIKSELLGIDETLREEFGKIIYLNNWESCVEINKSKNPSILRIGSKNNAAFEFEFSSLVDGKNIIFIDNGGNKSDCLKVLFANNYQAFILSPKNLMETSSSSDTSFPILAIPHSKKSTVAELKRLAVEFKSENLYLGMFDKSKILKVVHKIIPPYLTPARIFGYIKRRFKQLYTK